MEPNAKVIADSVAPSGIRLTTLEVVIHRFVLAEFNTHRVFSRNSASSRAIPLAKQLARVTDDPAIPVGFPAEQKGMQGGDELDPAAADEAEAVWLYARSWAVKCAEELGALGVHKSIANRLLEPFMWHTVVVTATDWRGFWKQRCSALAQPEIRVAAEAMRAAYDASTPTEIPHGHWHLPYVDDETRETVNLRTEGRTADYNEMLVRVSAARCARVSYLTHDGTRDLQADFDLYDRLTSADPPHASPLEHVATPLRHLDQPCPGNFRGWRQLRHERLGL